MNMTIGVNLIPNGKGFVGRECPKCFQYFKVKPGTGLPTTTCHCPYCGYTGDHKEFVTKDQIEYAKSVALKEINRRIIEPELKKLENSFKELERATRGGFIQIQVKFQRSPLSFPLMDYQEKEVETYVVCDNCGLEFAIYGVFANCPDCGQLNALIIFRKSLEVALKRILLLDSIKEDADLREALLEDALSSGVSAFDAFGKALQLRYPDTLPQKTKNLFQKFQELSEALSNTVGKSLPDIIGQEKFDYIFKMFQVRHIYEHNMGVIDNDFIRKVPALAHLRGRKYPLQQNEIQDFLTFLLETGEKIIRIIEENPVK